MIEGYDNRIERPETLRVKVQRVDPRTGETVVGIVDCDPALAVAFDVRSQIEADIEAAIAARAVE